MDSSQRVTVAGSTNSQTPLQSLGALVEAEKTRFPTRSWSQESLFQTWGSSQRPRGRRTLGFQRVCGIQLVGCTAWGLGLIPRVTLEGWCLRGALGSRGRTAQRLPGWELGLETGPLENSSSTCPWLHWAGDSGGGGGVRPEMVLSLISEGLPSPPLPMLN